MLSASEMTSESTFLMPPIHLIFSCQITTVLGIINLLFAHYMTDQRLGVTLRSISLGGIPNNYVSFTKHMREKGYCTLNDVRSHMSRITLYLALPLAVL